MPKCSVCPSFHSDKLKMNNSNRAQSMDNVGIYTINVNEGFAVDVDSKDSAIEDKNGIGELPMTMTHPKAAASARKSGFCCKIKWTYWFNIPIFIIVAVALLLSQLGYIPHHYGGFYCGDPTISFKFDGDTVSIGLLLLGSAIIPLIMILIVEFILYRPETLSLKNARCQFALQNVRLWYGEYLLAFIFNLTLMDIIKVIVGEPRPHFLDTCRPDAAINCTVGQYISKYECTNTAHARYFVLDSNKSFPSGHTSLSVYLAIFLFCYLNARASSLAPRLACPVLQMLVLVWSIVCSYTRMTDHRHHWWDILAGAILGVVLSYYSVVLLCKNFVCDNPQLSRSTASNGDSGRSLDNHNSVRRLISTSSIKQDDLDSGLTPVM